MMKLRSLTEEDAARIKQWPRYTGDMEQMDYALREKGWLEECGAKPGSFLYAVDDGDDLIGFTILSMTGAAEAEFRIALRADKTGLRLGEDMTRETLQIGFEKHRLSHISLIVRTNNVRGITLYRRIGFVDCGASRKEIQGSLIEFRLMRMTSEEFTLAGLRNTGTPPEAVAQKPPRPVRALLVIDVQNDYVGGRLPIEFPPVEMSLANIGRAMDAAKAAGAPVVVVQHVSTEDAPFMARGTTGAGLHPTVTSRTFDHHILKESPSAFAGTDLEAWLRERGIDTIVIAGYMTHNCDFSTVVHAVHAGFKVEFLADATGSVSYANRAGSASAAEIHRIFTVVMQSRFAAVMNTEEWISFLAAGGEPHRDTIHSSNLRTRRRTGSPSD